MCPGPVYLLATATSRVVSKDKLEEWRAEISKKQRMKCDYNLGEFWLTRARAASALNRLPGPE